LLARVLAIVAWASLNQSFIKTSSSFYSETFNINRNILSLFIVSCI
jgi:hypothetical protein